MVGFNSWRKRLRKQVKYQYELKAWKSQDTLESIMNLPKAREQKEKETAVGNCREDKSLADREASPH